MKKKTIAIVLETIPVVSAVICYLLVGSSADSDLVRGAIRVTMLLAFLGFAFFFAGRRLAGGERAVRILGILDLLATLSVIVFYVLAIFAFGL